MASTKSLLKSARESYRNGEDQRVVEYCEQALELDGSCYDAYILLGKAAFSLKDYVKAHSAYTNATELNASRPLAWQGLAELYEEQQKPEQAVEVLQTLVDLAGEDIDKKRDFQLRLARNLQKANELTEAENVLTSVIESEPKEETLLSALCLLADVQLTAHETQLEERVKGVLDSMEGGSDCEPDAVRQQVIGEWMEEALQAHSPLSSTLEQIVNLTPPGPCYVKYHDSYLLMYCKAIYCAPPRSLHRYNLRLQALERCYKNILGKSGNSQGGCCSPQSFVTALRLLEVNEEILGGQKAVGGQDIGTPSLTRSSSLRGAHRATHPSGMFKSASAANLSNLHNLPPASDPGTPPPHKRRSSVPSLLDRYASESGRLRIKLTQPFPRFDSGDHSTGGRTPPAYGASPRLSQTASPRLTVSVSPRTSTSMERRRSLSGSTDLPTITEGDLSSLPKFMRSGSLQCVRKLHRLGSGLLNGTEDVLGGNTPLLTEVTERISTRLIHMFPWNPEAQVELAMALRRRKRQGATKDDHPPERRVTDFALVDKKATSTIKNWNLSVIKLLERGIDFSTRSVTARVALVELLMDEGKYQQALTHAQEALEWLRQKLHRGGYPRTQAVLSLRLLCGQCLLKLDRLDEATATFQNLAETVSEGEVSFGSLAGSLPVSIRQAAHKGLAHVALSKGDRVLAMRKYEEVLGAGLMGKAPVEHWAHAEYGWMLYENGDTVRAKTHLEKALQVVEELDPVSLATVVADYNYKLGAIYWALGKKWRKEKSYAFTQLLKSAKVEGPHQADAFALLGEYYLREGQDRERAKKCLKKALSLNPTQVDAVKGMLMEAQSQDDGLQSSS